MSVYVCVRHVQRSCRSCTTITVAAHASYKPLARVKQEGLAVASIQRDVAVTPPRDHNAWYILDRNFGSICHRVCCELACIT